MSYSEFKTIAEVRDRFELRVDESKNLFADIPPVEVREFLQQILERNIPLANAINTEKACSELLIAPTYWKSCIYLIIRTYPRELQEGEVECHSPLHIAFSR